MPKPRSKFTLAVYDLVRQIPKGKVATYGQIAGMLGHPRAAQQVGWTLHWSDESEDIPAQRVVNRFGGLASGYGWGGRDRHRADLEAEGVKVRDDYTVDLDKYQWWPEDDVQ